jgi:pyruvate dehydrogenase E2 component (dihydrolipoamide acetyltransferase)
MVPTVRDADAMSVPELSKEIRALAEECRNGSIDPEKLQGGTFTVTNLGMYGVEMFTPILNPPQVGILGVGTVTVQARQNEKGETEFVPCLGLSLTFNHKGIDGGPAAQFLKLVSEYISEFTSLFEK